MTISMEKIKTIFQSYCTSEETEISVDCLDEILRFLGLTPSKLEVLDMINDLKPKTSFNIDELIYFTYHNCRNYDAYQDLCESFKIFDPQNTGHLSIDLVRKILKSFQCAFDDSQVDSILSHAKISNHEVNYQEISKILLNIDS